MENYHIFNYLSDTDIKRIFETGSVRKFKRKSTIFNQGEDSDSVCLILSGKVKIYVSDMDGRVTIVRLLGTGEYFGELGLIDSLPRSATVEALEDTQLNIISQEKFREYLRKNADLASTLIPQLTARIRDLTTELMKSRTGNAYTCFRSVLYDLAIKQADGTFLIEQKFTQQEFGEFVGTARENINRFIKGLKRGEYIMENLLGQLVIQKTLPMNW